MSDNRRINRLDCSSDHHFLISLARLRFCTGAASVVTAPGRGTESLIVNYVAISSAFVAAAGQFVPELQERLKKSGNGLMRPTRRAQCSQEADRTVGSTGRASSKTSVCGLLVDWSIEVVVGAGAIKSYRVDDY